MKTILMSSVVVLSMASLAAAAEEASTSFSWRGVTFQPRAYAGYADYELKSGTFNADFTFADGSTFSGPVKATFDFFAHDKLQFSGLIWGVGGTIAYEKFFGDFYYQSTANITAYSAIDQQLTNSNGIRYDQNLGDVDAQHSDWAISLGYAINDQWSVFAGYKSGNTEWDQTFKQNFPPPDPSLIANGQLNAEFAQDGPFIGTSYSFLIGPGALTFKAAYAYLDGTYKWNANATVYDDPPYDQISQWKLDGNSNAYSLGVSWTQLMANNLGFSLGANYHNYKFDMSGTSTVRAQNLSIQNGSVSGGTLTESLFTLTASIFYRF